MLFLDPVTLLEVDFLASPLAPGNSCLQFDCGLILLCVSLGEVIDTSYSHCYSQGQHGRGTAHTGRRQETELWGGEGAWVPKEAWTC